MPNSMIPIDRSALVFRKSPANVAKGLPTWLARRALPQDAYPKKWSEMLFEAAEKGTIIYVCRSAPQPTVAYLNVLMQQGHLPAAQTVCGSPQGRIRRLMSRALGTPSNPLTYAEQDEWRLRWLIENEQNGILFVDQMSQNQIFAPRLLEVLLQSVQKTNHPVVLVPHAILTRFRSTEAPQEKPLDKSESKDRFGLWTSLLRQSVQPRFEVGEPIYLRDILEKGHAKRLTTLSRYLRTILHKKFADIDRVAFGPPVKTNRQLRNEVFADITLQDQIILHAEENERHPSVLESRARTYFNQIAAQPIRAYIKSMDWLLKGIWKIIYDDVIVDEQGLEDLREAGRQGPLVITPCHRSHIDYLIISQTFEWNKMAVPIIAAGENLNFFPLGPILRRCGAYFIRRSFKDDKLYGIVLRAYVRKLFSEGYAQEFFIEGGRSRSGKTLFPKFGILTMLVKAALESKDGDAIFCPTYIAYERLVESASYARELTGHNKEKESARGFLRASRILFKNFGTVYVTYDKPISLKSFFEGYGITAETIAGGVPSQQLKRAIQNLGFRIVYGINNATVVTAPNIAALILFGYRGRGIKRSNVDELVGLLLQHIDQMTDGRTHLSENLKSTPTEAVKIALEQFHTDGLISKESVGDHIYYRLKENHLLTLDFHKNTLIHFLVPEALLALAIRSLNIKPGDTIALDKVKDATYALSKIFKYEFIYRVGSTFDELFQETLNRVVSYRVLDVDSENGRITWNDTDFALRFGLFAANLLNGFVDSYVSVFFHAEELLGTPKPESTFVKSLLERAQSDFLVGKLVTAEAAHSVNIKHAIQFLVSAGILQQDTSAKHRPIRVGPHVDELGRLARLLASAKAPSASEYRFKPTTTT